jgi:hypothetical protein
MKDLENIDECLRWIKSGRPVRICWSSGCTAWSRYDNETGTLVVDTENVFLGGGSSTDGRDNANTLQDQSSVSVHQPSMRR